MEKSGKVTGAQANGTWEGQYGLMYKYEVAFDNGDAGEYSSNKYTDVNSIPFKVGQEATYEFVDGKYPKVKMPKKDFNGGSYQKKSSNPNTDRMIARQSSLKIALDYYAMKGLPGANTIEDVKHITDFAELLTDYVLKDSTPTTVSKPQQTQKPPQNTPKPPPPVNNDPQSHGDVDDLPF